MFGFSRALSELELGRRLTRRAWGGTQYLAYNNNRLYIYCDGGEAVLWAPKQDDLLAHDWLVHITPIELVSWVPTDTERG